MIVKLKEELGEEKGVFTHADVKAITPDNMAICDMLKCEETIQEDGSILEVVNKTDDNIVISGLTFTEEELAELNHRVEVSPEEI